MVEIDDDLQDALPQQAVLGILDIVLVATEADCLLIEAQQSKMNYYYM